MTDTQAPRICLHCKPGKSRKVHARGRCRACYDKWLKENNPEYAARQQENVAVWHAENRERARVNEANYRRRNPGSRAHKAYKLTREAYAEHMSKPCGICGAPSKHMDHDHATGAVRGGLCHRCNLGVGYLEGWFAEHQEAALGWIAQTNDRFERRRTDPSAAAG